MIKLAYVGHLDKMHNAESTPKGFEGISDFKFLSEAFFRKNYSDFSTTLPSVWSSQKCRSSHKCRPEMEETAWKIWDVNHWNENFPWKANKGPFTALRRYRGRRDLRHASRRWWRQRLQKGRQCKKLTAHISPQVNVKYEVCNSRQAKPKDGETFSCFHTRLRSLATWTVSQIPYGAKLCEKTSTYLASW